MKWNCRSVLGIQYMWTIAEIRKPATSHTVPIFGSDNRMV